MLDAMISSALKRLLDKHVHFRKRASVEEQRAQKYDRFLGGRQIASMYEHFRETGAYEAVLGLSDFFNFRLRNDEVQDFDVRWYKALYSASNMPSDMILEGLCKSKITGPCSASDRLGFSTSKKPFETMDRQVIYDGKRP